MRRFVAILTSLVPLALTACATSEVFRPNYGLAPPTVEPRDAVELHERPAGLAPGDRFRDCTVCPEMVVVSAGEFLMGSHPQEEGRVDDEGPRHRVTIGQAFAVGVHEVTYAQFAHFVRERGGPRGDVCIYWRGDWDGYWEQSREMSWQRPGFPQTADHPVVCIHWADARAYTDWLSERTGRSYRLLSEAEWEYVARAGMATRYHWGDEPLEGRANCGRCGTRWNRKGTAPTGSFPANPFGLHDTAGNVWEWTEDCVSANYTRAPADGSPQRTGNCGDRITRGGSWMSDLRYLRSAARNWSNAPANQIGFRVASPL